MYLSLVRYGNACFYYAQVFENVFLEIRNNLQVYTQNHAQVHAGSQYHRFIIYDYIIQRALLNISHYQESLQCFLLLSFSHYMAHQKLKSSNSNTIQIITFPTRNVDSIYSF